MLTTSMTMSDAILQVAESRPSQEVFVCCRTRFTNRQLLDRIRSLQRGLADLGITKGDRVATILPPGPGFAVLFFALAGLGAVMVPLSPEMRLQGLRDILTDADPAAVVSVEPLAEEVLQALPRAPRLILAERGDPSLESLMEAGSPLQAPVPVSPEDLLTLLYTSGTTGRPKATMHSHRSMIAPVVATLKVRELWLRPSSLRTVVDMARTVTRYRSRVLRAAGRPQTILSTGGWHTITGLHVMLQGLLMGDRLAVLPRFHPQEALSMVAREHVTVLVAVPVAYLAMLALADFDGYDTSSLMVCATGGAHCPPTLALEIKQRFKCALYNGFGMTETAGGIAVTSLSDSNAEQSQTVGRPMPGIDLRIVDEQRRDLSPGEVGELAVRGEGVMLGYYHAPEQTANVLDGEGWLYTGDLARIDEKGYLHIVGRSKDVIIRGGQNIYPAEIENHLHAHPAIMEAAVVGVPARVGGEAVWAFVRLREGCAMTAQAVLDYCRGTLEPFKVPSQVRFVSELPHAEQGKSQKFKLRAAATSELSGGAS